MTKSGGALPDGSSSSPGGGPLFAKWLQGHALSQQQRCCDVGHPAERAVGISILNQQDRMSKQNVAETSSPVHGVRTLFKSPSGSQEIKRERTHI